MSDDAMEVWEQAFAAALNRGDKHASRIIQQYGDQREAAGYRRGVDDAAALWQRHKYNGSFGEQIAALLETQEKG